MQKENKLSSFKKIMIFLLIIFIILIISLSIFFIANICNNNISLTYGKYYNDDYVVTVSDKNVIIQTNKSLIKYQIDKIDKNIIFVSGNEITDYILIFNDTTLYINWLQEYIYYVE